MENMETWKTWARPGKAIHPAAQSYTGAWLALRGTLPVPLEAGQQGKLATVPRGTGPRRAVLVGCKEQDGCYIVKETVNKWKGKKISISFLQGIGLRAWEVSSSRFPGDRTHLRALPGGASPTKWGMHFPQPQKAGGAAGFQRGKPFRLNQQNAGICAPSPAPQSPTKQARIFFDVVSQKYPDGSQKVPVGSGTVSEGLRSRIYFRERVCRLHNHFLCTCPCESLES